MKKLINNKWRYIKSFQINYLINNKKDSIIKVDLHFICLIFALIEK